MPPARSATGGRLAVVSDLERDQLLALWERADRAIRAALDAVQLDERVRGEVLEYLNVNELGLAFQWLVESLADAGADVSEAVLQHLAAAAREMSLEDDPAWRRLMD
jgi:hypothetical protein